MGLLARLRFFSPDDIDAAASTGSSRRAEVLRAICQNTLEQTVLAAGAYGAWIFAGPPRDGGLVISCVALFSVGRLLFLIGYGRGAAARALGFGLTFYPTVALYVLVLPTVAATLVGVPRR